MMRVTRDVILDLLPLYLGNEVSADTRALVDEYLETDPELAQIAERLGSKGLPGEIPIPLGEEDKMEAYKEAKRLMMVRTIVLAVVVPLSVLALAGGAFLVVARLLG